MRIRYAAIENQINWNVTTTQKILILKIEDYPTKRYTYLPDHHTNNQIYCYHTMAVEGLDSKNSLSIDLTAQRPRECF